MEKKKTNLAIIIILPLILILLGTLGYLVYDKLTNKTNNLQEYIDKGYSILNLDSIDLTEDLESITTEQYFDKNTYILENPWEKDSYYKYELRNGIVYFEYNNIKYELPFQNVKKIFLITNDNISPNEYFYLIDNNGNIYESRYFDPDYMLCGLSISCNIITHIQNTIKSFNKINKRMNFKDAFIAWDFSGESSWEYEVVGITHNNKKYVINTEEEFKLSNHAGYLVFEKLILDTDRTLTVHNYYEPRYSKLNVNDLLKDKKIKVFTSELYTVAEDNKLYELKQISNVNNKYESKLINESEIKYFLYKESKSSKYLNDIVILFKNNDKLEIKETELIYNWDKFVYKYTF